MELLDRVRHPNIISVMGVSEGYENYYIVMEYYDCASLFHVIFTPDVKKTYELNFEQKNHISKQLCLALNYLHLDDNPIIHRDVKLGNVLVEWSPERRILYNIKLCDLGMSKCHQLRSELQSSLNKHVRGTIFYNSPEIFRNDQTISTKADVWSTGCTLIELYTEQRVWPFDDPHEVRETVLAGNSPSTEHVPDFLKTIISKSLKIDSTERCTIQDILSVVQTKIDSTKSLNEF